MLIEFGHEVNVQVSCNLRRVINLALRTEKPLIRLPRGVKKALRHLIRKKLGLHIHRFGNVFQMSAVYYYLLIPICGHHENGELFSMILCLEECYEITLTCMEPQTFQSIFLTGWKVEDWEKIKGQQVSASSLLRYREELEQGEISENPYWSMGEWADEDDIYEDDGID